MIQILPQAIAAADAYLSQHGLSNAKSLKRLDEVKQLIERFETPYGMELLSTVHWLATHENISLKDEKGLIDALHRWNPRKAALMKPIHIQKAVNRLSRFF